MKKFNFLHFCLLPAACFFCACSVLSCEKSGYEEISVLNWNCETFFDSVSDGTEYSEFLSAKSGWGEEKYKVRLERLCEVIKAANADLVVLEEIEKEEQIYDISNFLSGTFNLKNIYKYGTFAKEDGAAIGLAVLSRFPLEKSRLHSLSIKTEESKQPQLRPILELSVNVGEKTFTLFVNHWKSKSGGAEKSEVWRDAQEKVLASCIKRAAESGGVLACGDFNRDISEFTWKSDTSEKTYNVILSPEFSACPVYSPWILPGKGLLEPGSYRFKGEWSRIDHFFAANLEISEFSPLTSGHWADSNGCPQSYKIWKGSGYSDHLPIFCKIKIL